MIWLPSGSNTLLYFKKEIFSKVVPNRNVKFVENTTKTNIIDYTWKMLDTNTIRPTKIFPVFCINDSQPSFPNIRFYQVKTKNTTRVFARLYQTIFCRHCDWFEHLKVQKIRYCKIDLNPMIEIWIWKFHVRKWSVMRFCIDSFLFEVF